MKVYIVTTYFDYEGYGEVVKAFSNSKKAKEFKKEMLVWKNKGRDEDTWKEEYKSYYFDDIVIQAVDMEE